MPKNDESHVGADSGTQRTFRVSPFDRYGILHGRDFNQMRILMASKFPSRDNHIGDREHFRMHKSMRWTKPVRGQTPYQARASDLITSLGNDKITELPKPQDF